MVKHIWFLSYTFVCSVMSEQDDSDCRTGDQSTASASNGGATVRGKFNVKPLISPLYVLHVLFFLCQTN